MTKWIAVVTRTGARVFSEKNFRLIVEMKNPLGKEKNKAMTTGKPGVGRTKFKGGSPFGMTGEKNPHEDAAIAFARNVSEYLRKRLDEQRYDQVVIAAEPKMMGRIRGCLDESVQERAEWLRKDLGPLTAHEIKRFLKAKSGSL